MVVSSGFSIRPKAGCFAMHSGAEGVIHLGDFEAQGAALVGHQGAGPARRRDDAHSISIRYRREVQNM